MIHYFLSLFPSYRDPHQLFDDDDDKRVCAQLIESHPYAVAQSFSRWKRDDRRKSAATLFPFFRKMCRAYGEGTFCFSQPPSSLFPSFRSPVLFFLLSLPTRYQTVFLLGLSCLFRAEASF